MAREADVRGTGPGRGPTPGMATVDPAGDPYPGSPLLALGVGRMRSSPALRLSVRLGELAAAIGVAVGTLLTGSTAAVGVVGTVVSGLAWLAWIVAGDRRRPVAAALVVMAAAGGTASGTRLPGVVFVGVAAAGAAFAFELPIAVAVASPAVVAFLVVSWAQGALPSRPWLPVVVGLLGLVSGGGRRQLLQQGRQAALMASVEDRAAVARREAELMAERNRLGRELHDVLAHTLGAVSIQLTALDSRVAAGDPPPDVQARIGEVHRLVGQGLEEARQAVSALREDGPPLATQLQRLCDLHAAKLDVQRPVPPMSPEVALTLYRVAQEALTNVDKHAPSATAAVSVSFEADRARVRVGNPHPVGATRSPLASSGGGHGLVGLRERVKLAGGTLEAGPTDEGWQVVADVPRR